IAPDELPLVLAECYQSMRRQDAALEQFQLALKAKPDDLLTLRRAAEFHLKRGAYGEAEPLLQRLLDPESKAQAADRAFGRRGLALVMATNKPYKELQQAIALLDENLKDDPASLEDRKNKALLLARSPAQGDRREAIAALEDLLRQATNDNAARLLLAQLHLAARDVSQARRQFQTLLAEASDNPIYISNYVRLLLRGSEIEEADLWVGKLEDLQPTAIETKELRARLLVAKGDAQGAVDLLVGLLAEPDGPPGETKDSAVSKRRVSPERVALVLESLAGVAARTGSPQAESAGGEPDDKSPSPLDAQVNEQSKILLSAAEEQLRRAAAKTNAGRTALAAFLGRRGRIPEALAIWDEFFDGDGFE
ncbi:MAG: tetratricopeptide repeat protein, partial [Pirellulales bacterium]